MIMILARFCYHIVSSLELALNQHSISRSLLYLNHYTYFIIVPVEQVLGKVQMNALYNACYNYVIIIRCD